MSQKDLAIKLDVSRQTMSKWENDQCVPELYRIKQLCEIFEIAADHFIFEKSACKEKALNQSLKPLIITLIITLRVLS